MSKSRGTISFHRLFAAGDLKVNNAGLYVDRIIQEFLNIGEGVAGRWIQMPKGVLFLQQAPEDPASGAIYIYDRERQELYMVCFEGPDDHLTLPEFRQLMPEYNLLHYAEHPALMRCAVQSTASA
jgi:hypothetical protein